MDKPNYILPYSIEERCLNGEFFQEGVVIDESSGSTGIPYNWVRNLKEREFVIPGDVIAEGIDYLPGNGVYRDGNQLIAQQIDITFSKTHY